MGPCTASSCCCQARNLPWAPVPPPHAAARSTVSHGSLYGLPLLLSVSIATLCHVPLSGLLTLLVCSIFCHRVLADYGPPIAAVRPVICHGPPYRPPPHAAARSTVSHGSLYGLPLLLSPSPHSAMC
ncbi:unnamed protein product, partial [Staurois parvus]